MGYRGYVMTDWGGYGDEGLSALASAGISLITPGDSKEEFAGPIEKALDDGILSRKAVEENLCAFLATIV